MGGAVTASFVSGVEMMKMKPERMRPITAEAENTSLSVRFFNVLEKEINK